MRAGLPSPDGAPAARAECGTKSANHHRLPMSTRAAPAIACSISARAFAVSHGLLTKLVFKTLEIRSLYSEPIFWQR